MNKKLNIFSINNPLIELEKRIEGKNKMKTVDLRSDTVTKPSPEMWKRVKSMDNSDIGNSGKNLFKISKVLRALGFF